MAMGAMRLPNARGALCLLVVGNMCFYAGYLCFIHTLCIWCTVFVLILLLLARDYHHHALLVSGCCRHSANEHSLTCDILGMLFGAFACVDCSRHRHIHTPRGQTACVLHAHTKSHTITPTPTHVCINDERVCGGLRATFPLLYQCPRFVRQ